MFTKKDAEVIAEKLNARIVTGKRHDIAQFWHEGKLIVWYGIRRGSQANLPHNHIPRQLNITPHQCREFRICKMDLDALIVSLRAKGIIP
jgi:hypothetical protein